MSVTETEIQGICEAGYEPLRDAFVENFAERNEIGASIAPSLSMGTTSLTCGQAGPIRPGPGSGRKTP